MQELFINAHRLYVRFTAYIYILAELPSNVWVKKAVTHVKTFKVTLHCFSLS